MQKKGGLKLILSLILIVILVVIIVIVYQYFKSPYRGIGIGAEIENFTISEDGKTAYIKLAVESFVNVTKIKFIFTDKEGREYYYETTEWTEEIEVPFERNFWQWFLGYPQYKGRFDYSISSNAVGIENFFSIKDIQVNLEYETFIPQVNITQNQTGTNRTANTSGGGGSRGGGGENGDDEQHPTPEFIQPESIIPRPQNITLLSSSPVIVDSSWKIVADLNDEYENFTAYYLKNKTLGITGINLEVKNLSELTNITNKRIMIGNPNKNLNISEIASSEGINISLEVQKGFNQGYILLIKPEQILILANSTAGTFYGMISLTWLLKQDGSLIELPNTKITDWPDLEFRGFYGSTTSYIEFDAYSQKYWPPYYSRSEEWIEHLARYKYNLWINVQTTTDFAKKRHFFVSHSISPSAATYSNNNTYEGVYSENVSLSFNESEIAVSTEEPFVVYNSGFEEGLGKDGFMANWTYWKGSRDFDENNEWELDCTERHSGSCSAKLTLKHNFMGTTESSAFLYTLTNSTEPRSPLNKSYSVKPNKIYMLAFWAKKIEQGAKLAGQIQVTLVPLDDEGNPTSTGLSASALIDANESAWKSYKILFPTFLENISKFYIYSRAQGDSNFAPQGEGSLELWLDDFELIDLGSPLLNVIETNATRLHVYNKEKTIEYQKDIDYTITETGNFNFSYPFEGKKTSIKRINPSMPDEILADYDFVVNFQPTRNEYFSFSEPLVFEIYNQRLNSSIRSLDIDYMFVGMDEVRGMNRDSRSKKRELENYELFAEVMNNITYYIHSYDPNIKVFIWDDMISPFHNGKDVNYQAMYGGQKGASWYAVDLIKRENAVFIPWWYNERDYYKKMTDSPKWYNTLGFEWFGGPWYNEQNIMWWSYLCYNYNASGMIDHEFNNNIEGVPIAANYSWNAVKINPNLEICDGIDNDGDAKYWRSNSNYTDWPNSINPNFTDEGFNLTSDPFNCGSCGNICYSPQTYTTCINGRCEIATWLGDDGCYRGYTCSKILEVTEKEEKIEEIKTLSSFTKIVNFFKSLLTKKTAYAITGNTIKRKFVYRNESKM